MKTGKSVLPPAKRNRLKAAIESFKNENVFTLTELEGFLHGLVITPDMVMPIEWIPVVFDGTPEFESEEHARGVMEPLFDAYNTYERARNKGTLKFPLNLLPPSKEMVYEIKQWCYGFMEALALRPEIWFMDAFKKGINLDDLSEIERTVALSVTTIGAVAYPGEFIKILVETRTIDDNEEEISAIISEKISDVPFAVEILQSYGNNLWQEKLSR